MNDYIMLYYVILYIYYDTIFVGVVIIDVLIFVVMVVVVVLFQNKLRRLNVQSRSGPLCLFELLTVPRTKHFNSAAQLI